MTQPPALPETCLLTMEAVLQDPLEPGADAEAHMDLCRACSEARVAYLAQEETPEALAPAGYFERLPGRVLRKLPLRTGLHRQLRPLTWAAAAALLMAVGAGAFWAGRANRTPLVEASVQAPTPEAQDALPDTPFQDAEDAVALLKALPPEEAEAVLRSLAARPAHPPVAK